MKRTSFLPPYVNRANVIGSPQPFQCKFLHGHHFVFRGDYSALEELCARYLTNPTEGQIRYVPLTDLVLIIVNDVGADTSTGVGFRDVGWAPERSMAVFVLTAALDSQASIPTLDHLAWFCPYIFIDGNATAITLGREVYGFPKEEALIDFTSGDSLNLTVDAFAISNFAPTSRLAWLRLLQIRKVDAKRFDRPKLDADPWPDFFNLETARDWWQHIVERPLLPLPANPRVSGVASTLLQMLRRDIPMVFLKQFYDAEDGERACYQAIVEAPLQVSHFRGGGELKDDYELTISPRASHPLASDLGIKDTIHDGVREKPRAVLAYKVEWDATLGRGRTVWPR